LYTLLSRATVTEPAALDCAEEMGGVPLLSIISAECLS